MVRRFARRLLKRFLENRGPQSAAALTYTTLFAVVPVMTVMLVVLTAIPAFKDVSGALQGFIFRHLLPDAGAQVLNYLGTFSQQARKLTWVGMVILLFTALFTLTTIERAFNQIWRVPRNRGAVSGFLRYWAVLTLGPLLLAAGFAMSTYVLSLSRQGGLPGIDMLLSLAPLLISFVVFSLLYVAVPNARVPPKHALLGGALTAFLFEMSKALFGLYVAYFPGYRLIYGAFAAFPIFLVWIYLSWLLVLLGAEFVHQLGMPVTWRRVGQCPPLVSVLVVLSRLQKAHHCGERVPIAQLLPANLSIDETVLRAQLAWLETQRLACRDSHGDWLLCRDLSEVALEAWLLSCPWPLPAVAELPPEMAVPEPWFPRLRQALVALEQTRQQQFSGHLAQWLTQEKNA